MISATIVEAKANFSALVKRAQTGEVVLITSGRKKIPVARLVSIHYAGKNGLG